MKTVTSRRVWLLATSVGILAVAAGIAYAAIPDAEKRIHVCFKDSRATTPGGAALFIIDPERGGVCKKGHTKATFTKQGLVTGDTAGVSVGIGEDPQPAGESVQVRTLRPTKLFVFGRIDGEVTCAAGTGCSLGYQIFVGNRPVPDAAAFVSGGPREQLAVFGVVPVGAGVHTVQFRVKATPNLVGSSSGLTVGAIALGAKKAG